MRKLITIPTIHSPELMALNKEQGDASSSLHNIGSKISEGGHAKRLWGIVKGTLETKKFSRVRVFVEGFTGEPKVVKPGEFDNLLDSPIPEQATLARILADGGIIEHTEDIELHQQRGRYFNKQAEIMKKAAEREAREGRLPDRFTKEEFGELQIIEGQYEVAKQKGDEYIAGRIAKTLQEGETGVLLMGGSHVPIIESHLPDDIQREPLDERLLELVRELLETEAEKSRSEGRLQEFFNPQSRK